MSIIRFFVTLTIFLTAIFHSNTHAQCSFTASDNSYRVDVKVHVISLSVSPTGGDCTFNYAVIQYDIDFVSLNGNPPPSSMYTLQGSVMCNGRTMTFDLPNEGGPYISGQPNAWATTNSATAGGNPFNPSHGSCSGYSASSCNQIRIIIEGLNIPSQTVICTSTPTPLSTRLESFDLSTADNTSVGINWSTADETNVSHFIVEHSGENGFFEPIAKLNAAGKSNKITDYSVVHENQIPGIHFYRLVEVTTSGDEEILETKAIQLLGKNSMLIYPNPTEEGMVTTLVHTPKKDKQSKIDIYSTVGMLVNQIELNTGTSVYEMALPKGQYFIHLTEDGTTVEVKSVIVL